MPATVTDFPSRKELKVDLIPNELKQKPKWVLWRWEKRGDKFTKPPFTPKNERAAVNDPNTWSSFEEVVSAYQDGSYAGIGWVITDDDDILAYDLDHCLDEKNGNIQDWAESLIKQLNSYTEVTPSGDGLRVILKGDVPADGRQKRHLPSPDGKKRGAVECYKNKRFITVTGNHYPTFPNHLETRPDSIWKEFFEKKESKEFKGLSKNDKVKDLLEGNWQAHYGSQSDADLGLCRYLAEIANGDFKRIDELFRQTKLFRAKWDVVHHSDGRTYGQGTIQTAVESFERCFHLTDTGDAKRFAKVVGDRVRYVGGRWYIWNGKRWEEDTTYKIYNFIDDLCRAIVEESMSSDITEERKKSLINHSRGLESKARTEAVLSLARSREPIPANINILDKNQQAFNCENGIMERGDLREHDITELMTKISPVSYDPRADSPTWHQFLNEIIGDQELINYLARCVGYSMTGLTVEQVIFFLYGLGANGKSTFINTIQHIFGDYARSIPSEILMVGKEQHPTGLSDLRGIRMAISSELNEGQRFNEKLLKWLTGEETIVARRMHQDFFEFIPRFKLWIVGNHKPTIRGTDFAIRRRFQLIPFTKTIPKDKQNPLLKDQLRKEITGILNWCVRGYLDWSEQGLNPPQKVRDFTHEYFENQDQLGLFLSEECEFEEGYYIFVKEFYDKYVTYSKRRNDYILSHKVLSQKMLEKGFQTIKTNVGNKYVGFRFKKDETDRISELM